MPKHIIGFVGEIAGGKGAASDYLTKKYNAGYHRYSTILRDILDRLYQKQTRETIQKLSTAIRQSLGEDILATTMVTQVMNDPAEIVCVDGIRRTADITNLSTLPHFTLIYVTADEEIRYQRLRSRAENIGDQVKTFEQFQEEQRREPEQNIDDVAQTADYTIINNGSVEEMQQEIDTIMTTILHD